MRGDGLRLGWRALVGIVLVGVLFLHGFDSSFSLDGYSMGILGLLVVLALAGELESARVGGIDIRFRKLALRQIEIDLDDLPPPGQVDGLGDEGDDEGEPASEPHRSPPESLRAVAQAEPMAAVLSFFSEVERAIEDLYAPIRVQAAESASLSQRVDVLTRYGVISASEARIVLDLVALRNAYMHGRGVDPEEAMRLVAVGARLLPTLERAGRRLGRAFEERVGQILEGVPDLEFSHQPVLEGDGPGRFRRRPDFLVTAPVKVLVEAVLITHPANLAKRCQGIALKYEDFEPGEVVVVVPVATREALGRRKDQLRHTWLPIDELQGWLEDRISS
jgi:hypothetical protein